MTIKVYKTEIFETEAMLARCVFFLLDFFGYKDKIKV